MATSGDRYLATSGDFFMATDTPDATASTHLRSSRQRTDPRQPKPAPPRSCPRARGWRCGVLSVEDRAMRLHRLSDCQSGARQVDGLLEVRRAQRLRRGAPLHCEVGGSWCLAQGVTSTSPPIPTDRMLERLHYYSRRRTPKDLGPAPDHHRVEHSAPATLLRDATVVDSARSRTRPPARMSTSAHVNDETLGHVDDWGKEARDGYPHRDGRATEWRCDERIGVPLPLPGNDLTSRLGHDLTCRLGYD